MSWPDWVTPDFVEHCQAVCAKAEQRRALDPDGSGRERALQAMHWIIIGKAIGAWADIVYEGPGAVF